MERSSPITTSELVAFLKAASVTSGFLDSLKVHYRPYICPFDDLLNGMADGQYKSVFDVGCGSGQFALLLAEYAPVTKISGIEIDQRLISNANQLLSKYRNKIDISFNVYNGAVLPDDIANHDVVFLIDVLHHVPKTMQSDFLRQLYEKMRPGAKLIIKDINAGSPFVLFNKFHDLIFAREIGNEWSANRLSAECKKLGFKIESLKRRQLYVYPHFTLILKK